MRVEDVKDCAIIGCGVMGFGITVLLLNKGYSVTVVEKDEKSLARGVHHIEKFYEGSVRRGKLTEEQVKANLEKLRKTTKISDIKGAQVVIEAVWEDLKVKQEVVAEAEKAVSDDAILMTNTSSIPVIEISQPLRKPERFIGFHFFNPPVVMRLIEVIPSLKTSQDTLNFAISWAKHLGKEPVVAKDTPGFIGNALLIPFILEAIWMKDKGISTPEDIDKACKLGLGYPMGPFELADFMGLDIILAIAENVYQRTKDSRFAVPPSLREYVNAGKLGRKTGEGFYNYKAPKLFGID